MQWKTDTTRGTSAVSFINPLLCYHLWRRCNQQDCKCTLAKVSSWLSGCLQPLHVSICGLCFCFWANLIKFDQTLFRVVFVGLHICPEGEIFGLWLSFCKSWHEKIFFFARATHTVRLQMFFEIRVNGSWKKQFSALWLSYLWAVNLLCKNANL